MMENDELSAQISRGRSENDELLVQKLQGLIENYEQNWRKITSS